MDTLQYQAKTSKKQGVDVLLSSDDFHWCASAQCPPWAATLSRSSGSSLGAYSRVLHQLCTKAGTCLMCRHQQPCCTSCARPGLCA